jgi:hypothetical protein
MIRAAKKANQTVAGMCPFSNVNFMCLLARRQGRALVLPRALFERPEIPGPAMVARAVFLDKGGCFAAPR